MPHLRGTAYGVGIVKGWFGIWVVPLLNK